MADFGDEEYREMVCIEPSNALSPFKLASGEHVLFSHSIKQLSKL